MQLKEIDYNTEAYYKLHEKAGSVFNSPAWLKCFDNKRLQTFGFFDKDGKLFGAFSIYRPQGIDVRYKNLPFTPSIALMLLNPARNPSKSMTFEKSAMEVIADHFLRIKNAVVMFSFPARYRDMQPFIWKGYKVIPSYTYEYDLSNGIDTLMDCMAPERRNDLKKAEKDNIRIIRSFDYNTVLDLVRKTHIRNKKALNEKQINRILFEFADPSNSFSFIAYNHDIPVACSFCVHDKVTSYYLLGGYDDTFKHAGAGALAVWNAVKHSAELGLKTFDFEGSMLVPVEKYFRGFGAKLTDYYTVNRAIAPVEIILKIINRSVF